MLMLFGVLSGIGIAANDASESVDRQESAIQIDELLADTSESDVDNQTEGFGIYVDPETGEEHPILSSVDDIITEDAVLSELDGLYLMQFDDVDTHRTGLYVLQR